LYDGISPLTILQNMQFMDITLDNSS